jgi:hypothetical protein
MQKNWKLVIFWILGSLGILFGSMIAGKAETGLGVTELSYFTAIFLAFILILVSGLLWISVAIAARRS